MSRKVNYFEAQRAFTPRTSSVLIGLRSDIIPALLSAIETRKARSFWADDVSWANAYQALTEAQLALLSDSKIDIMRAIFYLKGHAPDVELGENNFPLVELPESSLFDIRKHIADPGDPTLVTIMKGIRAALQAEGPDGETVGALIKTLVLYLTV